MFVRYRKLSPRDAARKSMERKLSHELRRSSKRRFSKAKCRNIASSFIKNLDFDDPYQMHKTMRGYADMIVSHSNIE